jgi:hypothetical protein
MIIEPSYIRLSKKYFFFANKKYFQKKKTSFDPVRVLFRVTFNLNSISQGKRPKETKISFRKKKML